MNNMASIIVILVLFAVASVSQAKESGEKGGTADINIGIGELQECSKTRQRSCKEKPTKPEPNKHLNKKDGSKPAGLLLPAIQKAR